MPPSKIALLGLVGPTASGKTELAIQLCDTLGGEIVGLDASQVYRGLDIGTGKALPHELGRVSQHLVDVVAPGEAFDAMKYVARVDALLPDIAARGCLPILCGGTGLYLRALLQGLCQAPPVSPEVRHALDDVIASGQLKTLYDELAVVDPASAKRINPNDRQRIGRALGVYKTTGRTLTSWRADEVRQADGRYPSLLIGIRWPRAELVKRIEQRVDAMWSAGWVEEVSALVAEYGREKIEGVNAIGYGHIVRMLAGESGVDETIAAIKTVTRRYAKRQMTWFLHQADVHWFGGPVEVEAVKAFLDEKGQLLGMGAVT